MFPCGREPPRSWIIQPTRWTTLASARGIGMRTALVSNGARRIGRYLERSFMREGYAVAILCNGSRYEADHLGLGASLWRTSDTLAG